MSDFISFNETILSAKKGFLSAISSSALYGRGIFTTVAIHDSVPFLWEKHWQRLTENALRIGINLARFSEEATRNSLLEIVGKNNLEFGRARLTFFDESAAAIWQVKPPSPQTNLLIQTAGVRPVAENFRLTVSPFRVNTKSPLVGVKSCNYLENILAFRKAQQTGFDEALRLNEKDEIVSACLTNIFWTKNDKIFTPALETGALQGTTREFIMENFTVFETNAKLEEIETAETIFLASSGIGIVETANFEQRRCVPSEGFRQIKKFFRQTVKKAADNKQLS